MRAVFPRAHASATVLALVLLLPVGRGALAAQQPSPTPPDAQATPPAAQPPPPTDPLDRLEAALAAERDRRRADAQSKKKKFARIDAEHDAGDYYRDRTERLLHIRNRPEAERETALADFVRDLRSSARSDELRRVCDDLGEQFEKKRQALIEAYAERAEKFLRQTGDTVLRAKEPKDLDASIQEIERVLETAPSRNGPKSADAENITYRLRGAVTFLHHWQDYLQAMVRKDQDLATSIMRTLSVTGNERDDPALVPRSEILARIPATAERPVSLIPTEADTTAADQTRAEVLSILVGTRTLEEVPAALGKLGELKNKPVPNPTLNAQRSGLDYVLATIQSLQASRQELATGAEFSISVPQLGAGENHPEHTSEGALARLRADLLILALPRMLGAGEEKPVPDEGLEVCIRRLAEAAKKRGDWDTVLRAVELGRALGPAPGFYTPVDLSNEKEAFQQFRVGRTMESAGQAQQAAAAYLLALKTGAKDLPVSLIGERLGVIQREHPQDYAAANTYVLNQPPPTATPTPADLADPTPVHRRMVGAFDSAGGLYRSDVTNRILVVPARKPAGG